MHPERRLHKVFVERKGKVFDLGDQRLGTGRDKMIHKPQLTLPDRHTVHQRRPDQTGQGGVETFASRRKDHQTRGKFTKIKGSLVVAGNLYHQAFKNELLDFDFPFQQRKPMQQNQNFFTGKIRLLRGRSLKRHLTQLHSDAFRKIQLCGTDLHIPLGFRVDFLSHRVTQSFKVLQLDVKHRYHHQAQEHQRGKNRINQFSFGNRHLILGKPGLHASRPFKSLS